MNMEESIQSSSKSVEQHSPKKKPLSPTDQAKVDLAEAIRLKKKELVQWRGQVQRSKWDEKRLTKKELEEEAKREAEREILYRKSVVTVM